MIFEERARWQVTRLIMVPRSHNARGLRTRYVLADPPRVHRKGLTRASQNILTYRRGAEPEQVQDCVEASAWSLRCVNVGP